MLNIQSPALLPSAVWRPQPHKNDHNYYRLVHTLYKNDGIKIFQIVSRADLFKYEPPALFPSGGSRRHKMNHNGHIVHTNNINIWRIQIDAYFHSCSCQKKCPFTILCQSIVFVSEGLDQYQFQVLLYVPSLPRVLELSRDPCTFF